MQAITDRHELRPGPARPGPVGLRRRWGVWPLVVFPAGAAAIGSVGYLASGELWTTALAGWVYAADLLVFAALSVS